jgi:hypothetical protein
MALDGVGDEADGAVMFLRRFEGFQQGRQIMTAEIAHQPRQLAVGTALDQLRDRPLVADIVMQALAPGGTALKGQR